ncbi:Polynucleotide 5'-hydroxyl-kinase nol9 [Tritrichomonas musculus]|uniref:Polynucleotide 5'-hydroxyl-kinase nol9 n=1 Tax=Tritrichomonas musculus TaxID=1915356 RepID=A0ABR2INL4_9EUKA
MGDSQVLNLNAGTHSFYGMMKITVISGTPCVMGAILSPGFSDIFYAPTYNLPLMFECEASFSLRVASLPSNYITFNELKFYLPRDTPDGFNKILNGIYYSPIIKGISVPPPVQRFVDRISNGRCVSTIMVCGNKGAGKSTFTRYLINRLLNSKRKVACLDIDPGQPEFSLPGCLTLTYVDDFCFNNPEHNVLQRNQKRVFYGSNTPSDNLEYYKSCISYLVHQFINENNEEEEENNSSDGTFLVVNSFGWVQDLGFTIHQEIINEIIHPKQVIILHKPDEKPAPLADPMFRYEVQPKSGPFQATPKMLRDLRIIGYFRRKQMYLSAQQPIEVNLKTIRIGFLTVNVPPSETLTAICGSIVAFLNDERKFPKNKKLVSLLTAPPMCDCTGFGFVRAIDKNKGILYIDTPEKKATFNTLLMGQIAVPTCFYTETHRCDANYIGIGILDKAGASTDPLLLKNPTAID